MKRAARLWSIRAHAELEAAARFERLADELAAVGGAAAVVAMARAAAQDERRHHLLCATLVRRFGGRPPPRGRVGAAPLRVGLTNRREQLVYEVVAMSCVTETLSTALLVTMRDEATDPVVRATVHEVLIDEVRHSRLGWAHLAHESTRIGLGFLGPRLPAMLAQTVSEELFADASEPESVDLTGVGGLGRAQRCRIFTDTMRTVVFPGLQRFGVDTKWADEWLEARLDLGASRQRTRPELLAQLS